MAALAHRAGWQPAVGVSEESLRLPAPSATLPPLRIAFASDFHAGPTTHPRAITEACRVLTRLQPDLLLLGGDYVSLNARYIEPLATQLVGAVDVQVLHHDQLGAVGRRAL
jgi:predicted MPP superfamily phosphohydrolase